MMNEERRPGNAFDTLKELESELFGKNKTARNLDNIRRLENSRTGLEARKLDSEAANARKEAAALRGELGALRLLLAEQDVLTVSAFSALRELKKDFDRVKAQLDRKETDLSDLASEVSRLKSELEREKKRGMELGEKLASEAARREDAENALREPARREAPVKQRPVFQGMYLRKYFSTIPYPSRERTR